jgi:hypothetical protein
MEQNGKLAGYGNNGLVSGLFAASGSQMKTPLLERRVFTVRPEDMVRALDQQTSEIGVARMGDTELRIMIA